MTRAGSRHASASGFLLAAALLGGCDVSPTAEDHCEATIDAPPGCPAAAVVVMSDYVSTQVALTKLDGDTLCGSFASSARTGASALALPLSGDVVVPTTPPRSGRVVLVDRYGTNVVSFFEAPSGRALGQLAVGTGFESNPQDYLEISGDRAVVSRWGEDPTPGSEPFDGGGDLLVIDTLSPSLLSRIPLPDEGNFPPRPAGLALVGDLVLVTLQRASLDVKSMGEARVVGVDVDRESVTFTLPVAGLKNCGPVTLAPSARRAALSCTGYIDREGVPADVSESAVVLFDVTEAPPREIARYAAIDIAGAPLQSNVAFFAEDGLLVKTQTALAGGANNRLFSLDLASGAAEMLAEARAGDEGGLGVAFGGLLCTPGCAQTCLVADADRGGLMRFSITPDGLSPLPTLGVAGTVGLPPRDLGAY